MRAIRGRTRRSASRADSACREKCGACPASSTAAPSSAAARGSGERIFRILVRRRGKDVSNSHFSPLAPCQKTGGSMMMPSYVFHRRTSRSTNFTTSSRIHRMVLSGIPESARFFCAQPIVGFEASTFLVFNIKSQQTLTRKTPLTIFKSNQVHPLIVLRKENTFAPQRAFNFPSLRQLLHYNQCHR